MTFDLFTNTIIMLFAPSLLEILFIIIFLLVAKLLFCYYLYNDYCYYVYELYYYIVYNLQQAHILLHRIKNI